MTDKNALIIGATGLLGYGVTEKLSKCGWNVRAIGKDPVDKVFFNDSIEYIDCDFYDEKILRKMLTRIDKVFFFLSTTFPSSSIDSLKLEVDQTIYSLDYLIRTMRNCGVSEIIFPSSGGTVYGDIPVGKAKEDDILKPTTPYGVGKMLCEKILAFYADHGIVPTVLRVGNVYGSPLIRKKAQGAIDVFVQKALAHDKITIWGNALASIRDYIFLDDFALAVSKIANMSFSGMEIFNISYGKGTTLGDILKLIEANIGCTLDVEYSSNESESSIKRVVLDNSKVTKATGWTPKYDINSGIIETIIRKNR